MIELVYISRAVQRMRNDELTELLFAARKKNTSLGITGLLIYDGFGTFMQLLEGTEEKVESLFNNIVLDKRHTSINRIWTDEIEERGFGEWKMAFRNLNESPPHDLEGFSDFLLQPNSREYLLNNQGFATEMLNHFKSKHT